MLAVWAVCHLLWGVWRYVTSCLSPLRFGGVICELLPLGDGWLSIMYMLCFKVSCLYLSQPILIMSIREGKGGGGGRQNTTLLPAINPPHEAECTLRMHINSDCSYVGGAPRFTLLTMLNYCTQLSFLISTIQVSTCLLEMHVEGIFNPNIMTSSRVASAVLLVV